MKPYVYVCTTCGSSDVSLEGFIGWDAAKQRFEVHDLCDKGHSCNTCEGECNVERAPAYKCPACNWIGSEDDMKGSTCCPECNDVTAILMRATQDQVFHVTTVVEMEAENKDQALELCRLGFGRRVLVSVDEA